MSPKVIVKAKAAIFIISTVVLAVSLILSELGRLNFLVFLLVLLVVFVGANAAYRSIDKKRSQKQRRNLI